MNKRIGMAVTSSINGPWKRVDTPVILPRPGKWDATITSNPSPVILPDMSIYLMYKFSTHGLQPSLMLGAAICKKNYGRTYKRISDEPLFHFYDIEKGNNNLEDPFVWWSGNHYELIMKDRFGYICGEGGGGIHATSKNGVNWILSKPVKAYSRTIKWDDGTTTHQANFERPCLLFNEKGKPTYLFAVTGSGEKPYQVDKTWNMVIPLKQFHILS